MEEFNEAYGLARSQCNDQIAWALGIARVFGLRVEETTGLYRGQLVDTLNNGYLSLTKTKGGIPRDVPINYPPHTRRLFEKIVTTVDTPLIFIGHGRTQKQAITRIHNWIYTHRNKFSTNDQRKLTYHGIRYTYRKWDV